MPTTRNLAILIFDDVEVLDFCGPFEVFFGRMGSNRVTKAETTFVSGSFGRCYGSCPATSGSSLATGCNGSEKYGNGV
jgi:hypothetical protein